MIYLAKTCNLLIFRTKTGMSWRDSAKKSFCGNLEMSLYNSLGVLRIRQTGWQTKFRLMFSIYVPSFYLYHLILLAPQAHVIHNNIKLDSLCKVTCPEQGSWDLIYTL